MNNNSEIDSKLPSFFPSLEDDKNEIILELPDNKRKLAYRVCGKIPCRRNNYFPSALVYAFHGALGIGDFDVWSSIFTELGWFVVTPTLPGWGLSSPLHSPGDTASSYGYTLSSYVSNDFARLHQHILETYFDDKTSEKPKTTYCLGISYGCIHAMAIAMHDHKMHPNQNNKAFDIDGLCLLGPHGPFDDRNFDPLNGMALPSKMGLGSMGYYIPSLTRFTAGIVQSSVSTPSKAKQFVQTNLLDAMNPAEKSQYESSPNKLLKTKIASGQGLYNSMCQTTQGYIDIPFVLRSWSHQDLQYLTDIPTYVFVAKGDVQTPLHGAKYTHDKIMSLSSSAKNNFHQFKVFAEGGHMTLVFWLDQCAQTFDKFMNEL